MEQNKIINIENDVLQQFCVKLLSKTFLELRQKTSAEDIVSIAIILSNDLKEDWRNLTLPDIEHAFRIGVRKGNEFHLNTPTMYKWIKEHKKLIQLNSQTEEQYQDRRLRYRSKKNTGLNTITNTIKKLL